MLETNPFLQKFYSPNILAVASSLVGEDSLSHHVDPAIGVYIIDRYSCVKNMLHIHERSPMKTTAQVHLLCPGVPRECHTKLKEDDGGIP